jgi:nanoRNase/pAp phosphatase (c-di-AMP/oligoRNAs hydrolase)
MAYDTRHFMLATSEAFRIAANLVAKGVNALEAMKSLQVPMAESERIARLKASQRLVITRMGGWILVSTHVGSHQASAARALVMLGADVAIVAAEKKAQVRMSLRSTQDFYDKTKVHLGRDVAKKVGKIIQGAGGGHALAAGIYGQTEKEVALERCLSTIREEMANKK